MFQKVGSVGLLRVGDINSYVYIKKNSRGGQPATMFGTEMLQELLGYQVHEVHEFCGFCEKYSECKSLSEISKRLGNAYFFYKRKVAPFQPICWKVYTFTVTSSTHFRLTISTVIKSW